MTETRTGIIGLSQREAHANLQRHIQRGTGSAIERSYLVHHSPSTKARPLTFWEILALAAIVVLKT